METKKYPGWTLLELLVVMILTGLVLVAALDGLDLVRRFALRGITAWTETVELLDGYSRTNCLFLSADSLEWQEAGCRLYRNRLEVASIWWKGPWLICTCRGQTDTLFRTVRQSAVGKGGLELILQSKGKDLTLLFGLPSRPEKGGGVSGREQEEKYENQLRSWKSSGHPGH